MDFPRGRPRPAARAARAAHAADPTASSGPSRPAQHRAGTGIGAKIGLSAIVIALGVIVIVRLLQTGSKHPASQAAPPSAAISSPASAATTLADLAQTATGAVYTGTYVADSSGTPPRESTITVYRTATQTRLDVTESDGHVLIQVDPSGTYTCNVPTSGTPSCLTLAGAGEPVPANINPSGQALFTTTLDVLAAGTDLTVTSEPPSPQAAALPKSTCYAVIAAPNGASPGTYCFTAGGILTRAQFRSNVLALSSLGGAPTASDFTFPAQPLPVGSAAAASSDAAASPASSSS